MENSLHYNYSYVEANGPTGVSVLIKLSDNSLTLGELSSATKLSADTLVTMVQCGIVEPEGDDPEHWLFAPRMVPVIQRAGRLQRDLALEWPAVALALDLMADLQRLRDENKRLRRQLDALMELDSSA
ncbi:MAG: chaperone modulator CbpM [Pseudomonadota bacterium]